MKKKVNVLLCVFLLLLLLCSCGRSDMTLTVNKDGTIDAEIVYGIDKSLVAGDDVLNQVTELIKQPLNECGIKYTEKDEGDFYRIYVTKSFKNAAALTDSSQWQGIPFVPQFTSAQIQNAITVTAENGKINFKGTLNSDSYNATQLLSDNKKAFGASITVIASGAKANVKKSDKDTYKWEGTAEDTVSLELTAKYNGDDLKPSSPSEQPSAEQSSAGQSPTEQPSTEQSSAGKSSAEHPQAEAGSGAASQNNPAAENTKTGKFSAASAAACAAVIIILLLLIAYKLKWLPVNKKSASEDILPAAKDKQQEGEDDTCQ